MIKSYEDYKLLLDCFEIVDKFTRDGLRYEMTGMEALALRNMLDILKPNLGDLH